MAAAVSAASRRHALATLRVLGPDCIGIVAAYSDLLSSHGCGIVQTEHYTDPSAKMFFQRILFEPSPTVQRDSVIKDMNVVSNRFGVQADIDFRNKRQRCAIMVSRTDHCLWELLLRHQSHELACDIPLVLSNHDHLRPVADTFGIPYYSIPLTAETKSQQEQIQLNLLQEHKVDVVVLARYMQVLSPHFLETYRHRIINIHHSFLPAFSGGRAYHQAHERGVKLIGATAHYATTDLDEGPIIEQDVVSVSHRDSVSDYRAKGRILERNVLVRALQAHLDHRILVYNNKCVVFGD